MSFEEVLREIVREVVRDEVRAALDEMRVPARNSGDSYLSVAKAAAFADVAPGTLRRWIRSGRLPVHRAGRVYRIGRGELETFLATGRSADVVAKARAIVRRAP